MLAASHHSIDPALRLGVISKTAPDSLSGVLCPARNFLARMSFGDTGMDPNHFGIPLATLESDQLATTLLTLETPSYSQPSHYMAIAETSDFIFGSIRIPGDNIEAVTTSAYQQILDTLADHPGFRLIRLWHYLPNIHGEEYGLERYRGFSKARHAMLSGAGFNMTHDLPAASAIGSREGPFVVHFLAGNGQISAIENPRQVSAYRYPSAYGPRSPAFSRAVVHKNTRGSQLFVSGTASIIGHASVAPMDPVSQTQITFDNLDVLMKSADLESETAFGPGTYWCIYVRKASDLPLIRSIVTARMHPRAQVVFLEGDICRKELLVEIEGAILT